MWKVAGRTVHVHHEGWIAVKPQRAGRDERAFDAMRAALPQHFAHGENRFTAKFVIGRDGVEVRLNLLRRGKPVERGELATRETQILAPDALTKMGGRGHDG